MLPAQFVNQREVRGVEMKMACQGVRRRRPGESAVARLALIEKTAAMALADYIEVIELVTPTTVPRVVPGDIDDDQVIAAAVAAQADLIVSGDRKHLLPLGSHAGIAIIDAVEALRRIEPLQA